MTDKNPQKGANDIILKLKIYQRLLICHFTWHHFYNPCSVGIKLPFYIIVISSVKVASLSPSYYVLFCRKNYVWNLKPSPRRRVTETFSLWPICRWYHCVTFYNTKIRNCVAGWLFFALSEINFIILFLFYCFFCTFAFALPTNFSESGGAKFLWVINIAIVLFGDVPEPCNFC